MGAGRVSNSPSRSYQEEVASVFEQAFKNIDDVLRKEAGCTTELDYTEIMDEIAKLDAESAEVLRKIGALL